MKNIEVIARITNDFNTKFGIPRQSGMADSVVSKIVFEEKYRFPEALRGIENYSHLWLLWGFSENGDEWSPTVRPPKTGGNKRVGVFATRSPFRPNGIGLSSVKLEKVEDNALFVTGADLMNGTPIYDIKPYLPYADCHTDAYGGLSDSNKKDVVFETDVPEEIKEQLMQILELDPRPGYHDTPERVYKFEFGGFKISFTADCEKIYVKEILKEE